MLKQIVIIDDHDSDLLYGRIIVERANVAESVLSFGDARDALVHLQTASGREVGLVLLDINMPGMDGFEFLAAFEPLRESGAVRAWVAMLTSSPDPRDRERAQAFRSVTDYLVKPISIERMRALAQRLAIVGPPGRA
jgi:CheY-like chemotaxis protein